MPELSSLIFECPSCNARLRVSRSAAGKSIRCPKCNAVGTVPAAEPEPILVEPDEGFSAAPARPPVPAVMPDDRPRRRPPPRGRPGLVTTIAVFHLIAAFVFFAGFVLALVLQVRGALGGAFLGSDEAGKARLARYQDLYEDVDKGMPAHRLLLGVDAVFCLAFAGLLVASAIGLLQMRPWGRTLSLIFSSAALVRGLTMLLYALLFALPTVSQITQHALEGDLGQFKVDADAIRNAGSLIKVMLVILPLVGLIYPVLSLLAMLRPSVSERLSPAED
jgi:predicted Zn finger-like uncharacterized protein